MAYNPTTGEWDTEDASVSSRLTGLLSKESPLIKQARTQGLQTANSRGLLNSSMAVGASQNAAYAAALPIASQEAAQVQQSNLSKQDFGQTKTLQASDQEQQRYLQSQDIGSREKMQGADIGSRESMQGRDIEQQRYLQEQDTASRERIAGLDREAQQRIASMNLGANERAAASSLAASFENSYSSVVANIMNNTELPAGTRQQYLDQAAKVRDSNLALVEQMYGIDLNWNTSGTAPGSTGGTPASGGGTPSTGGFALGVQQPVAFRGDTSPGEFIGQTRPYSKFDPATNRSDVQGQMEWTADGWIINT